MAEAGIPQVVAAPDRSGPDDGGGKTGGPGLADQAFLLEFRLCIGGETQRPLHQRSILGKNLFAGRRLVVVDRERADVHEPPHAGAPGSRPAMPQWRRPCPGTVRQQIAACVGARWMTASALSSASHQPSGRRRSPTIGSTPGAACRSPEAERRDRTKPTTA